VRDSAGAQPGPGLVKDTPEDISSPPQLYVLRYRIVLFLEKASPARSWVSVAAVQQGFAGIPETVLRRTLEKMQDDGVIALADRDGVSSAQLLRKL
jgi:hypothetical protein